MVTQRTCPCCVCGSAEQGLVVKGISAGHGHLVHSAPEKISGHCMTSTPDFSLFPGHFPALLPLLLLAALLLDRWLGEPARFHPLVGFGNWAAWLERRLNTAAPRPLAGRALGVLALLLALSPLLLIGALLLWLYQQMPVLFWLAQIVILYSCIGWQSLQQHVQAVAQALQVDNLPLARERLSWMVSRDTAELSDAEVAQASLESLLENSLDALFATLFWFCLGGALAALMHRWVNTLDAMWGYKNSRFRYFGWAAARLDDTLAYIPARLTALSFVLLGRYKKQALTCWRQQAPACASPNGGPVMTAGAGALNIRLSERARYHGEWQIKPSMGAGNAAIVADIQPAFQLIKRVILLWLLIAVVAGWNFSA